MKFRSILTIGLIWAFMAPAKCWRIEPDPALFKPIHFKDISSLDIPKPENVLTLDSCIQIAGYMNITIPVLHYTRAFKALLSSEVLQVPSNASVTGQCHSGPTIQRLLQLSWRDSSSIDSILEFRFSTQDESYSLDSIFFRQPKRKLQAMFYDLGPLTTSTNHGNSRLCTAHQLTDSLSKISLTLKDFRFEVFPTTSLTNIEPHFNPAVDICTADDNMSSTDGILSALTGTSLSTYLINLVILLISCFIVFGIVVGLIKLHKRYKRNKIGHDIKV